MNGKIALVTGGGSGLGRVMAKVLAERGAKVVVVDIADEPGAATAAEINGAGGDAIFVHADVSIEDDVRAAVDAAVSTYGGLDIAANNAGIDGDTLPLAEQTTEMFQRVIAVNLTGVFFGLKYELRLMVERGGGAIVNTSSIAGVRGHPGISPYVAAKHGVNGLTKAAAIEYGPLGVRVNSLCPGGIRTPMLDQYLESAPELKRTLIDNNPLRRFGEAEEMAFAAVWLCSDEASYVNGHELVVDGGKIASDV